MADRVRRKRRQEPVAFASGELIAMARRDIEPGIGFGRILPHAKTLCVDLSELALRFRIAFGGRSLDPVACDRYVLQYAPTVKIKLAEPTRRRRGAGIGGPRIPSQGRW